MDATLAVCCVIDRTESRRTPRSRTTSVALIVVSPMAIVWSCDDNLPWDPNQNYQIASVLSAFSWSRREAHHCLTSSVQSPSCRRRSAVWSSFALADSCLSSKVPIGLDWDVVMIVDNKIYHQWLCLQRMNWRNIKPGNLQCHG